MRPLRSSHASAPSHFYVSTPANSARSRTPGLKPGNYLPSFHQAIFSFSAGADVGFLSSTLRVLVIVFDGADGAAGAPGTTTGDFAVNACLNSSIVFSPPVLAAIDWALVPDENKRPKSVEEFKQALTAKSPVVVPGAPAAPPKTVTKTLKVDDKKPAPAENEKKTWWKLGK